MYGPSISYHDNNSTFQGMLVKDQFITKFSRWKDINLKYFNHSTEESIYVNSKPMVNDQQDSNQQPLSSWTKTQSFSQTGQMIELCSEYYCKCF